MIAVPKSGLFDTGFEFQYWVVGDMMTWWRSFYNAEFVDPRVKNPEIMVITLGIVMLILYFFVIQFFITGFKLCCNKSTKQQKEIMQDSEMAQFNSILVKQANEKYGDFGDPRAISGTYLTDFNLISQTLRGDF